VHNPEPAVLAVELMTEIFGVQGIPNLVHADRGTSMTSKPVVGPAPKVCDTNRPRFGT
jgi:putative transposase